MIVDRNDFAVGTIFGIKLGKDPVQLYMIVSCDLTESGRELYSTSGSIVKVIEKISTVDIELALYKELKHYPAKAVISLLSASTEDTFVFVNGRRYYLREYQILYMYSRYRIKLVRYLEDDEIQKYNEEIN